MAWCFFLCSSCLCPSWWSHSRSLHDRYFSDQCFVSPMCQIIDKKRWHLDWFRFGWSRSKFEAIFAHARSFPFALLSSYPTLDRVWRTGFRPHVFFTPLAFLVILFVARYAVQVHMRSASVSGCQNSLFRVPIVRSMDIMLRCTTFSWSSQVTLLHEWPRSASNLLFRSVLEQLKDIQQKSYNPHPHLVYFYHWSECLDHTETYAQLIRNPLAFDSSLAVTMAVFPRSYFISRLLSLLVSLMLNHMENMITPLQKPLFHLFQW